MRNLLLLAVAMLSAMVSMAQKKPLDHSVYDQWQSIGSRLISRDGRWIVYTIQPQEGDATLVIRSAATSFERRIPRGTDPVISQNSGFVVFRIAAPYADTRQAKIKKKKSEEMPKDSLAIYRFQADSLWKTARVKSFSLPEKGDGIVVYQREKNADAAKKSADKTSGKSNDSLIRVIDSLRSVIASARSKGAKNTDQRGQNREKDEVIVVAESDAVQAVSAQQAMGAAAYPGSLDAEGDDPASGSNDPGTDLVVRNLVTGSEKVYANVKSYLLSENGHRLVFRQTPPAGDTLARNEVVLLDLRMNKADSIASGGNDFKSFSFSRDGEQLAFVAERESKPKELMKFYKLFHFKTGMDTARMIVDKTSVGMKLGMTVSEFGDTRFSASGKRLFFGTAPVQPAKDTNLVDIDLAKLDVWHYQEDYLQPVQLARLTTDLQRKYLAVYDVERASMEQLGSPEIPQVYQTSEGDGAQFVGVTDVGHRVETQWTGSSKKSIYAINVSTGAARLVKKDGDVEIGADYISPTGRYILWYDDKLRNYFINDGDSTWNLTASIRTPLYDEENDTPADPNPYGVMGWHQGDSAVYISDRYDVWKIRLIGGRGISSLTRNAGRAGKTAYYPLVRDNKKEFYAYSDQVLFRSFNQVTKEAGLSVIGMDEQYWSQLELVDKGFALPSFIGRNQVSDSSQFLITRETYVRSPDLYLYSYAGMQPRNIGGSTLIRPTEIKLSSINSQQAGYNWGTAELYKWKTFSGKQSEGILYKPEDFDPTRKYPVIFYFYETLSDGLFNYIPPAPTPSRLNISFFVSRGYLVFAPDIRYTTGHPARSAYDYIVSAAKTLSRQSWVDSTKMGIQGQSWGGIQVAQLVTMTNLFRAAWAGAPVANMTSAYGGIRWESGMNRQFQYEKTQSRIGATLWEKPELYIENSPLFQVPKVKTPLVIMANDADGAVPWYQGIELFTALRRLNKPVWMLNYNGEAHNLVQRRNRKDIQVREQQYFDWLLKGAKPPVWITEGVPAVKKGRDWGLGISDQDE